MLGAKKPRRQIISISGCTNLQEYRIRADRERRCPKSSKQGGTVITGVSCLRRCPRSGDRTRTSPAPSPANKFEFRPRRIQRNVSGAQPVINHDRGE